MNCLCRLLFLQWVLAEIPAHPPMELGLWVAQPWTTLSDGHATLAIEWLDIRMPHVVLSGPGHDLYRSVNVCSHGNPFFFLTQVPDSCHTLCRWTVEYKHTLPTWGICFSVCLVHRANSTGCFRVNWNEVCYPLDLRICLWSCAWPIEHNRFDFLHFDSRNHLPGSWHPGSWLAHRRQVLHHGNERGVCLWPWLHYERHSTRVLWAKWPMERTDTALRRYAW